MLTFNNCSLTLTNFGMSYISNTVAPTGGLLFFSDFSTATGSTDAALRDTNKTLPWDTETSTHEAQEVLEVVNASAEGLTGWPSENALKVTAILNTGPVSGAYSGRSHLDHTNDHFAIPTTNGESLYFRYYVKATLPAGSQHAIESSPNTGDQTWGINYIGVSGSATYQVYWAVPTAAGPTAGGNAYPDNQWGPAAVKLVTGGVRTGIDFDVNQIYRHEFQLFRSSSTQMQLHIRIYDVTGSLLYDDPDMKNIDGTNNLGNTPGINIYDEDQFDGFCVGTNGVSPQEVSGSGGGSGSLPYTMYYQGAVAIRNDTWPGVYDSGSES